MSTFTAVVRSSHSFIQRFATRGTRLIPCRLLSAGTLLSALCSIALVGSLFADQTWIGGASGSWNNAANWSGGTTPADSEAVTFNTPGVVVTVDAAATIKMIRVHAPATLTLNAPFTISNSGTQGSEIFEDLLINGSSTLTFSRNGTSTTDYLDLFVRAPATLTIAAKLTGVTTGLEAWTTGNARTGTYVLANPANDFTLGIYLVQGAILSAPSLAAANSPSYLGSGSTESRFRTSGDATIRITGNTPSSTSRNIEIAGGAGYSTIIDAAGEGALTFSGTTTITADGTKFLRLAGNGTGGTYAGNITGTAARPLTIVKQGKSAWTLSGANTLAAITVIEGTLTAASASAVNAAAAVTLAGGTFSAASTLSAFPVTVTGPAELAIGANNLSLASLTIAPGGALDVTRTSGTLFVSGLAAGPLAGVTVNGSPAAYSTTLGVYPDPAAVAPIDVTTVLHTLAADSAVPAVRNLSGSAAILDLNGFTLTAATITASDGAPLTVKNGTLATPAGTLLLAGPVTIEATLAPGSVNIAKTGSGTGTVSSATFNIATIAQGALALATAAATTNTLETLLGAGELIKTGSGWLALAQANTNFTGNITVDNGTLMPAASQSIGYDDETRTVTVKSGGAVDMGLFTGTSSYTHRYLLRLAGDGPDGNGALVNNGLFYQYYTQPLIALDADASVGGLSRLDTRRNVDGTATIQPRLELNGHTLTVKGDHRSPSFRHTPVGTNFQFAVTSTDIRMNGPGGEPGKIAVGANSMFTMEFATSFADSSAANIVTVAEGGIFDVYNLSAPVPWTIQAASRSALRARSGYGRDTRNILAGPVTIIGTDDLTLTDVDNGRSLSFVNTISGTGGIQAYGGSSSDIFLLAPNNNYEGDTTVSSNRFTLFAAYPSSIPGWNTGKLTIENGGSIGLILGETAAEGWPLSDMFTIKNTLLSSDCGLALDTTLLNSPDITFADPLNHAIRKIGPGILNLDAPVNAWYFNIDGGFADFRDPGPHTLGYTRTYSGSIIITNDAAVSVVKPLLPAGADGNLYLADYAGQSSLSNRIGGTACVSMPDIGYNTRQQYFIVGQNGRAVLDITDDAFLQATLYIGRSGGATAAGAIYQSGNSIVTNTTGAANDGGIGTAANSYGYYGLESGLHHCKGYWQAAQGQNSYAIFRQTGGTFTMPGGAVPSQYVVGDYYGGSFTLTRGGFGFAFLLGGSFYHGGTLGVGGDGNSGYNTGAGALVIGGNADAKINGPIDIGRTDANAKGRRADLVLSGGGRLTANRIYAAGNNPTWKGVSFNGGTLVCTNNEVYVFNGANNESLAALNVVIHKGGFTLEVPDTALYGKTIDVPLRAPTGMMAVDMIFDTPITDYIAPPAVVNKYNGPDGPNGYVAEAIFDRSSGSVTGLKFHAPGSGMSSQPIATLKQGGHADVDVVLNVKPTVSGGFTKIGGGSVTLTAANTYTGPTIVHEGLMALNRADALSPATAITVGGTGSPARLDLRGFNINAAALKLEDGGEVVNGTINVAAITKTGAGTATLAVTPFITAPTPSTALTPGLWEGLTSRTDNDPYWYNSKQNVRLTTYAGNGGNSANTSKSDGMWAGNNHTYSYAGYIWNRTATNQVWNFRGAFDDYVYLVIDRSLVLSRNGNNGPEVGSFTAAPGPHFIDIRFGDGSGNVGCNLSGMLNSGLNWDGGDGKGWRVVTDPGDGSVLTTSTVNWDAAEATRNALPGQPGLFEGTVGGCGNSVEPNPCDGGVQLTPRAANGSISVPAGNNQFATMPNGYAWWNYSSAIYSGYVWNRSGATQNWTFIQNLDDSCLIVMDGAVVLSGRLSDTPTRIVTIPVTPGPHAFELRFGQHGGNAGGNIIPGSGFGIDLQGRGTTDSANFIIPYAYGNDMPEIYTETTPFFTTTLNGYVDTTSAVCVEEGTLALLPSPTPGLLFGEVDGYANWSAVPITTTVDLKTTVANTYGSPGHGDTFTLVYSGAIWNRTGQDITWSFMMDYDDGGRLVIDGTNVVIFAASSCKQVTGTVTLSPGPHAIELRFAENSGGDGPWSGTIPWAIGFKQGAVSTVWQDYTMLADPGDGSLLTTSMPADYSDTSFEVAAGATLDLGGGTCALDTLTGNGTIANGAFASGSVYRVKIDGNTSSCVTFNGVNLANLTVMPVDAASAEPTAPSYLIATGSINTKPILSGFPSKYKLMVSGGGTQLLLTSQGGTMLILK